ncbi:hypothetical protein C8F01DRAFT_333353 [Mycena amicta]|nr:hypothetical protein C8F01DRAFT_333353 [Mycena amicta]
MPSQVPRAPLSSTTTMSPPACWNCNAPMFPWDEDVCWNCNAPLLPWPSDVAPDRDYGVSSSWTGAHSAPARSYQLPQSPPRRVPRTLVSPPPPAPHLGSIPLPTHDQLHPMLTPEHALELQLDFSLPPAQFIATPSLTENLLGAPASRSLSTSLSVRISTPELGFPVLFKTCQQVLHRGGTIGDFVTVGDILAAIYRVLRERSTWWPPEYRPVSAETLETVNAYASRRIEKLYALGISAHEINAELEAGLRVVDRCAGHVLFAGLRVYMDPEDPLHETALRLGLAAPEDGLPGMDEQPQLDVPSPLGFRQPFAVPARLQALSPLIM